VRPLDAIEKKLTDLIDISEVPTLPEIARIAISRTLSMDKSAEEIASIIRENPSLTLKILRVANSPLYTPGARISSIKDAVILLGYKTIKSLILSITIKDIFSDEKEKWFNYPAFWLHSIATAVISEEIARELHAGTDGSEMDVYTAGLLHDIGKAILLVAERKQYEKIMKLIPEQKLTFSEAEQRIFGFDHSDVSAFLFKYWELSENLITPVRDHHREEEYLLQYPERNTIIVTVANQISHISGFNSHEAEPPYEVSRGLINMLGLDQQSMDRVLTDSRGYLETFADALNIPKTDIKGYFELLSSANRELGSMYIENQRKTEEINRKSSMCVELNRISRYCLYEHNLLSATKLSLRSLMNYFHFDYAWLELYLNREKSAICTARRPRLFGQQEVEHGTETLEERDLISTRGSAVVEDDAQLFPITANDEEEIGRIAITGSGKAAKGELKSFIDHMALGLSNVRLHFTNKVKTENLNIAVKHLKEEYGRRQSLTKLTDIILDATPVGILTVTAEGEIVQWNREAELLLKEPLTGKNLYTLGMFAAKAIGEKLRGLERGRQRRDLTVVHEKKLYHLLVESVPIEGSPHILLLINDISERLEEEKILIQKEKMATLGELAAGIAHNLRSPLAVVKGIPELILSDLQAGTVKITRKTDGKQVRDEEIEENLHLISKSMEKALSIIESIMEFAKKEPGQFETVELGNVIDEVHTLVQHKMKGKNIVFRNRAESCTLVADRNMMVQIFINLFNNSIRAVGESGVIEAECRREKGKTVIHFMDDGVGVEGDKLDQIFEPFFTTRGTADGTGIGLSITRKMVTLHGGSIKALPKSGGGTIIEIIFPDKEG
jgi:signal transduction histidine kinase/HD-like signal output (HDOD) protein